MSIFESGAKSPFDPTAHGFVFLPGHRPPGGVRYYEFRNHVVVDGSVDYHRLNLYLTQDGEFITIWWGSLDPIPIERLLCETGVAPASYDEPLFHGHVESDDQASHILRAFRLSATRPQILRHTSRGIVCESLSESLPS